MVAVYTAIAPFTVGLGLGLELGLGLGLGLGTTGCCLDLLQYITMPFILEYSYAQSTQHNYS